MPCPRGQPAHPNNPALLSDDLSETHPPRSAPGCCLFLSRRQSFPPHTFRYRLTGPRWTRARLELSFLTLPALFDGTVDSFSHRHRVSFFSSFLHSRVWIPASFSLNPLLTISFFFFHRSFLIPFASLRLCYAFLPSIAGSIRLSSASLDSNDIHLSNFRGKLLGNSQESGTWSRAQGKESREGSVKRRTRTDRRTNPGQTDRSTARRHHGSAYQEPLGSAHHPHGVSLYVIPLLLCARGPGVSRATAVEEFFRLQSRASLTR